MTDESSRDTPDTLIPTKDLPWQTEICPRTLLYASNALRFWPEDFRNACSARSINQQSIMILLSKLHVARKGKSPKTLEKMRKLIPCDRPSGCPLQNPRIGTQCDCVQKCFENLISYLCGITRNVIYRRYKDHDGNVVSLESWTGARDLPIDGPPLNETEAIQYVDSFIIFCTDKLGRSDPELDQYGAYLQMALSNDETSDREYLRERLFLGRRDDVTNLKKRLQRDFQQFLDAQEERAEQSGATCKPG